MEDIRENGRILKASIQSITSKALKRGKTFPANSIIISTTATIGEHALIEVDFLMNQQLTCISIKNEFKNIIYSKYLFFYGFVIGQWCRKNVPQGGFPLMSISKLSKFKIPIPPLSKQKEIVAILDKFDALVNDISTGLPAEIAARKKQYEYYRNQLLEFRVKSYEL